MNGGHGGVNEGKTIDLMDYLPGNSKRLSLRTDSSINYFLGAGSNACVFFRVFPVFTMFPAQPCKAGFIRARQVVLHVVAELPDVSWKSMQ